MGLVMIGRIMIFLMPPPMLFLGCVRLVTL